MAFLACRTGRRHLDLPREALIHCCVLYSFFAPGESLTNWILSIFDVEIGGKPCRWMVLSPAHIYRHCGGFSQLQLQQQEGLFFILIRFSKTNLSLVVMMTAVNLWKAPQAQQCQVLALLLHCAPECVYLGNFSTQEHGTLAL